MAALKHKRFKEPLKVRRIGGEREWYRGFFRLMADVMGRFLFFVPVS